MFTLMVFIRFGKNFGKKEWNPVASCMKNCNFGKKLNLKSWLYFQDQSL